MKRLDDTLNALSDQQLRLLSHWLNPHAADQAGGGRKQLRAYIVANGRQDNENLSGPALRAYLADRLPTHMIPDQFELVASLPRLPNGKLDRTALQRQAPAQPGAYGAARNGIAKPATQIEQILAQIWSETLQIEPIGLHDNYFELGGDSIVSIQIISKAREQGLALSHHHFQANATIAAMAAALVEQVSETEPSRQATRRTGDAIATPVQQWFLERKMARADHWNSARCFELTEPIPAGQIQVAIQACMDHHEGLRARFPASADGATVCRLDQPSEAGHLFEVLANVATDEQTGQALASLQQQFSLTDGPLIAFALRPANEQSPACLYVIAHHLLIDNVSWQVLTEDLETALAALSQSCPVELPERTSSLIDWSIQASRFADSPDCQSSLAYWQNCTSDMRVPVDRPLTAWPLEQSVQQVRATLDEQTSASLVADALRAYNTQVRDLLICALAMTLSGWTGRPDVQFDLEGHGREMFDPQIDISRTIGWFTSFFPLKLSLPAGEQPVDVIKQVKESLRQLPGNGSNFGLLRYLSGSQACRQSLAGIQNGQVLFNYLGRHRTNPAAGVLKSLSYEAAGLRAPDNARSHLIEINAAFTGGRLVSTWLYSSDVHDQRTIENIAAGFNDHLKALITHCLSPDAGGYTVSDFPEAGLDQDDLDNLLDSL